MLALGTVGAVPMQADFKGDLSNSPLAAADKKGNVAIKISGNPRVVDGDTLAYEPKMGEKTRIRLCVCVCAYVMGLRTCIAHAVARAHTHTRA